MEKVLAAFANKDSASVASFFTEDATWVLPNASTFKGRADIEKGATAFPRDVRNRRVRSA